MKNRYFIKLAYNGSAFHGWQRQSNAPSVQEVLERDVGLLLGEAVKITGCGRTDAGVHAREFFAHMDVERGDLEDDPSLLHRINGKLPPDIVIHDFIPVHPDAHARFHAVSRTYEYRIFRKKEVFQRKYGMYVFGSLRTGAMTEACEILKEYRDFTSFSKVDTETRTNDCRIDNATWEVSDEMLIFRIQADRFLRNMVRAIVGTMLDVGSGKLDLAGFRKVIESRDRSKAGPSVPAGGLFLTAVEYPSDIFIRG